MIFSKNKPNNPHSSEAGLTLIECLVAIAVIAITTASIGPMMVFSVATRVQNQKVEQALQLAQAEIDKVRLTVEQGGDYGQRLRNLSLYAANPAISVAANVPVPIEFLASTASVATDSSVAIRQARMVDIDGDGAPDFAIQLFRTTGREVAPITGSVSTPVVFQIGVRVYDARAAGRQVTTPGLEREEAGLAFTSGEGERGRRPLAVLYSQIAQGDRNGALCEYFRFAGSAPTGLVCN